MGQVGKTWGERQKVFNKHKNFTMLGLTSLVVTRIPETYATTLKACVLKSLWALLQLRHLLVQFHTQPPFTSDLISTEKVLICSYKLQGFTPLNLYIIFTCTSLKVTDFRDHLEEGQWRKIQQNASTIHTNLQETL